jgi:hypothetical protein
MPTLPPAPVGFPMTRPSCMGNMGGGKIGVMYYRPPDSGTGHTYAQPAGGQEYGAGVCVDGGIYRDGDLERVGKGIAPRKVVEGPLPMGKGAQRRVASGGPLDMWNGALADGECTRPWGERVVPGVHSFGGTGGERLASGPKVSSVPMRSKYAPM